MFGFIRRKQQERQAAFAADHALRGLPRGGRGVRPLSTLQRFPAASELAAMPELRFDPTRPDGKLFLGLTGASVDTAVDTRGRVTRHATGGVFLGVDDDRHVTICGSSRGGKGRAWIANTLATYSGSTLTMDPKGDGATDFAVHRAKALGQDVFVNDPFGVSGPQTLPYRATWNPLQHVDRNDPDALVSAAELIADAIIVMAGKEPHWDENARLFLEAVILHVLTHAKYERERTLVTVYRLLMSKVEVKGPDGLATQMVENEACNFAVAAGATAFYDKENRERSGVLSTLRRHIRFLGYPKIARSLQDGQYDLGALLRGPTSIFLSLPATRMGTCAGWLRLFVNMALNTFEANADRRQFQRRTGGPPALMLLDEFPTLRRVQRLEDAIGQVAGFGLKIVTILQDFTQLKALYSDRWETFLGNSGVIAFLGVNDLFTLQWIEKRLGNTLVHGLSQSTPTLDAAIKAGAVGESYSLASHPLMSVPEIAKLFNRDDPQQRMLVLLPSIGPVILQKAFYDKHPVLKGLHVH